MRSLLHELRVCLAELMLHRALDMMPQDAPEARPLALAARQYVEDVSQIARWEKFPA